MSGNSEISPTPKKKRDIKVAEIVPEISKTYKIELVFNEKAELVDVKYPSDMALGLLVEHLAIGTQWLGRVITSGE